MANTIKHKRSSTPAGTPGLGDLTLGELAVNTYDGKLFMKTDDNGGGTAIVEIGLLVDDTSPQLGANLDVNSNSIVSASAGNIAITPDTTGSIILDGLSWPQADGTANFVLETDGLGQLGWVAVASTFTFDPVNRSIYAGTGAGASLSTTAFDNFLVGLNAGTTIGNGDYNIAIGPGALATSSFNSWNTAIGRDALTACISDGNVGVGDSAGQATAAGHSNVYVGSAAGNNFTSANQNTCVGYHAGLAAVSATGGNNVLIGYQAGFLTSSGTDNVCVGFDAGRGITTAANNVLVGSGAGSKITTTSGNVCIGLDAGPLNGSNPVSKLFIDNTETDTPLIGGDFAGNTVTIEGDLTVSGTVSSGGSSTSHIVVETKIADYTLALADDGKMVQMNNSTNHTITIPLNSVVAFPIGTQILLERLGTGTLTIAVTVGDDLHSAGTLFDLASQYSTATLVKTTATRWLLMGDLA